jgi:peptidoglycan/xylan/chitin deacetylase (PgdA/CDA1 family)
MPKVYLTIDDGPSNHFTKLIDFLHERNIPAVFFNRGDMMDERPEAVIYGIKKGYLMANHTYSHRRASKLPLEKIYEEIEHTDRILHALYKKADVTRPGKYFRFPYMDRGMGPMLVEDLPRQYKAAHDELLGAGLGHAPEKPDAEHIHKKRYIQSHLKDMGYTQLPCKNITLSWYAHTEMAEAIDSLCTYSTSDWALLDRHKGKHGFSTIEDLTRKIDEDAGLKDESSNHIILAHDQDEIFDVVTALVDHMHKKGFEFLPFK